MITLHISKNHFDYKIEKNGKQTGGTICEEIFNPKLTDGWHKNKIGMNLYKTV
jgi:hypothetical protein